MAAAPSTASAATAGSATGSSTPPSTTAPEWPTPRSSTTNKPSPPSRFLERALLWFSLRGIAVEEVLTHNGPCYKSRVWAAACANAAIAHRRTRPYRPQTNGKVERFHRILLEEWAYIRPWTSERDRVAGYLAFMHFYNRHRSHGALGWHTPIATLARLQDNVPDQHT